MVMQNNITPDSAEIIIYTGSKGDVVLSADIKNDTIWATQEQIASLFGVQRPAITKHINNIYKSGELDEISVSSIWELTAADGKVYSTKVYSLDMILSVGYRVNSAQATDFRKWASSVLKDYTLKGIAVNEHRMTQLGQMAQILGRSNDELVSGIANVLDRFSAGLNLLDSYDHQTLIKPKGEASEWTLTYDEAREFIYSMVFGETSGLFGVERDDSFKGIIAGIYQSFGGIELYPSIQEKAANLLYLIVKDHSFTDGNKRIAAALFVYFLEKNGALRAPDGTTHISNNALAAITLMIALSKPEEKDMMCLIVMNMLDAEQ